MSFDHSDKSFQEAFDDDQAHRLSQFTEYVSSHPQLKFKTTDDYFADLLEAKRIWGEFTHRGGEVNPIAFDTGAGGFLPYPPIVSGLQQLLKVSPRSVVMYDETAPSKRNEKLFDRYCREEGIIRADQSIFDEKKETSGDMIAVGNGTTQLYSLGLKGMIKTKGDIILVPVPTYGLFFDQIELAQGKAEIIQLTSETDWKLTPSQLDAAIKKYNIELFEEAKEDILHEYVGVKRKLDKLGIKIDIPEIKATNREDFSAAIAEINSLILARAKEKDILIHKLPSLPSLPQVRGLLHINPHNPSGAIYDRQEIDALAEVIKQHPGVIVIDDLSHFHVVLGDRRPATFYSSEVPIQDQVFTLVGISKAFCAGNIRGGVCFGPREIIEKLQIELLHNSSNLSIHASTALERVFGSRREERHAYLDHNNEEYRFRRDLMSAMFNGIDNLKLPTEQAILIAEQVAYTLQMIVESYKFNWDLVDSLLKGIDGIKMLTNPEGSFFHILELSGVKNQCIGTYKLERDMDFHHVFYGLYSVKTIPGELSASFSDKPMLRFTFSHDPAVIVQGAFKIWQTCQMMRPYPYQLEKTAEDVWQLVPVVSPREEKKAEKKPEKISSPIVSSEAGKLGSKAQHVSDTELVISRGKARALMKKMIEDIKKEIKKHKPESKLGQARGFLYSKTKLSFFEPGVSRESFEEFNKHIEKLYNDLRDKSKLGLSTQDILKSFVEVVSANQPLRSHFQSYLDEIAKLKINLERTTAPRIQSVG